MMRDIESKPMEFAVARSSEWFRIHAEQRLKIFNFYIILLIGLIAGFSAAFKEDLLFLEFIASIILLFITYAFKNLDRRSAALVKDAERALQQIDKIIAEKTNCSEFDLISAAENKHGIPSYRQSFNLIFGLGGASGAAGLFVFLWHMVC